MTWRWIQLTDAAAIMAIKMIAHYLPKAVANGNYMKARDKMAYAQYLAGIAFNNASLGYVHAMAHQLGGFYNLPHGVCNAILLPYVESYNLIGNMNRFRDVAQAMGVQVEGISVTCAAEKAIEAIKKLSRKDVCQLTNPRTATREQVIEIYRQAYVGE